MSESPEIAVLKRIGLVALAKVPAVSAACAAAGGGRVGLSVGIGGVLAFGLLAITAGAAALFGRVRDSAVPVSYVIGFFIKLGLLTVLMMALRRIETVSIPAVALSTGGVYLVLLGIGVAPSGGRIAKFEKPALRTSEAGKGS